MIHDRKLKLIPCEPPRGGVTLTEVLMSLMIMSIGVSAVAVLFPISMLRSLQANQLTNGAVLKYNVEAFLAAHPMFIFNPDGDFDASGNPNFQNQFRAVGQRNYMVDPVGFYTNLLDGNTTYALTFGNDGAGGAALGIPRFGGGLTTTDGGNPATSPTHARALKLLADSIANQGDGWETQIDTQVTLDASLTLNDGNGVVGLILPFDLDLSAIPTSTQSIPFVGAVPLIIDPEQFRIVLYSENGKRSIAYPLTHIVNRDPLIATTQNEVYWCENYPGNGGAGGYLDFNYNGAVDARHLPSEFLFDTDGNLVPETYTGRVLLQSRKINDYNWMLTVRRRGDGAVRNVDVVVKYSDGIDARNERVFEATFVAGSNLVGVRNASDGTKPNIVKGKYIFDATHAIWYRVQDVQEKPLFAATTGFWGTYDYQVSVEDGIQLANGVGNDQSPMDGTSDTPAAITFGPAMFPAGIVDIYSMGSMNIPSNLLPSQF